MCTTKHFPVQGKKLSKQEKAALAHGKGPGSPDSTSQELVETEYLEAKKAYQQQLKAGKMLKGSKIWCIRCRLAAEARDEWERAVEAAERALRDKDRVRWAYRPDQRLTPKPRSASGCKQEAQNKHLQGSGPQQACPAARR